MAGAKRKYIEAAYELLARDGVEGVSIRKVADEVGCSSAALYRHFPDIEMLIAVASMRFLRDYIEDARILSKVDLNPLELNLQLWECLAYYSFRNADVFENLFFSASGELYAQAAEAYYAEYPEDLAGLKDFMLDMLRNATVVERDNILLNRAVENGMLSVDAARYLCKIDSYLFRGMLADVSGRDLADEDFRWVTRDFMNLLIRSYTTQLQEGFSILVVKPDFEYAKPNDSADDRSLYRVRTIPLSIDTSYKRKERATA